MAKRLTAFKLRPDATELRPAALRRDWMDAYSNKHPYHCLPLVLANQSGWAMISPDEVSFVWDGNPSKDGVKVSGPGADAWHSHFGHGVVTRRADHLFRTEPGYNLRLSGVPNHVQDGIQPLEAIIETDWAPQTFTINLKMTRVGHEVRIAKGAPFVCLTPVRRGEAEGFAPEIRDLADDPALERQYNRFRNKRQFANYVMDRQGKDAPPRLDGDYTQGLAPNEGTPFPDHQTRIKLKPFADSTAPAASDEPESTGD